MAKAEISWKRVTTEGVKVQIYVHHVGHEWRFYWRERRYDAWQTLLEPPLEDWLALLDGVRRRIARRLVRPEEESNLRKLIHEKFPERMS